MENGIGEHKVRQAQEIYEKENYYKVHVQRTFLLSKMNIFTAMAALEFK